MKIISKAVCTSLALIVSITGYANANEFTDRWTSFYKTDDQQKFVDLTTVKRNGDIVRMWELTNFENPDNGTASDIALHEYDCKGLRWRAIALRTFGQPSGQGPFLVSNDTPNAEWRYVVPRSIAESSLLYFCKLIKKSR